jgi:hypothetical protein
MNDRGGFAGLWVCDGTLNAAIGVVDTQLPLGILPLGTANDGFNVGILDKY